MRVLFVGNSFVYAKPGGVANLAIPEQFKTMANLAGHSLTYGASYIGGGSLEDHWNDDFRVTAKNEITSGTYDLVIMNGSGDSTFDTYADLLAGFAQSNGLPVVFYGLWANDAQISVSGGAPEALENNAEYRAAALRNDAGYAPNAISMMEAHALLSALYGNGDNGQTAEDLLTQDGVHPTALGAYLVANTLFRAVFGEAPPPPSQFRPAGVTLADAQRMDTIAANAMAAHGIAVDDAGSGGGGGGGGSTTEASVSGRYFLDANGNGIEDGGEAGISGLSVALLSGASTIATTSTAGDGSYSFTGLAAGSYTVQFAAPGSGLEFTDPNVGSNDAVDSDVTQILGSGAGRTGTVAVSTNQEVTDVDAGAKAVSTGGGGGGGGNDPAIFTPNPADYDAIIDGTSNPETVNGTGGNDYISARGGADTVNGFRGDDYLFGGLGVDKMYGGAGNDVFLFDPIDDTIHGGGDVDRIMFRDGGTQDATGVRFYSVEIFDLANGLVDDIVFNYNQIRAGQDQELRILGDMDDVVRIDRALDITFLGSVSEDGQTYDRYQFGAATFGIDSDMDLYVAGLLV